MGIKVSQTEPSTIPTQSTHSFRSAEERGVNSLAVELKYQQPFARTADCIFKPCEYCVDKCLFNFFPPSADKKSDLEDSPAEEGANDEDSPDGEEEDADKSGEVRELLT